MQKINKVSVILPAYNEAGILKSLIRQIKAVSGDYEVIVVDDGSTDDTYGVAREEGAVAIRHTYNIGNGSAVKTGIRAAGGEVVVLMDSDGQHSPQDIPKLLEALEGYDMVVAARTRNSDVSLFRAFGNMLLIKVAEFLSGHKILDLTSGFRAIRKEKVMEFLHLFPNRYSYPTTITLSMFKSGYFIKYLPLNSISRRKDGSSRIQPIRDGFRFINIMLRIIMLFEPQKIFLPVSAIFFALGCSWGIYSVITKNVLIMTAALFIIMGAFTFLFGLLAEQIASIRREMNEK